jgi:hypothetical protein
MSNSVNREDWLTETLDEIANKCLGVKDRSTYVPSTMADEIASKIEAAKRRIDLLTQQLEAEKERADGNWNALERIKVYWEADRQKLEAERAKVLVLQSVLSKFDGMRKHGSDFKKGTHAAIAWDALDNLAVLQAPEVKA